jgi:hypothetical protein
MPAMPSSPASAAGGDRTPQQVAATGSSPRKVRTVGMKSGYGPMPVQRKAIGQRAPSGKKVTFRSTGR